MNPYAPPLTSPTLAPTRKTLRSRGLLIRAIALFARVVAAGLYILGGGLVVLSVCVIGFIVVDPAMRQAYNHNDFLVRNMVSNYVILILLGLLVAAGEYMIHQFLNRRKDSQETRNP